MKTKPPTYRQRAIATTVNNVSALRDLIIDLAEEIDNIKSALDTLSENQPDELETDTETEVN